MDSINDLLEDIVRECGGMGKFQWILLAIMFGTKVTVTWSMLMMTFGGATPDWWCNIQNMTSSDVNTLGNHSTALLKQCAPPINISGSCDARSFSSDKNTLVSEVGYMKCNNETIHTVRIYLLRRIQAKVNRMLELN